MATLADNPQAPPTRPPLFKAGAVVVVGCIGLGVIGALDMRFVSQTHGAPIPWSFVLMATMPRWLLLAATLPMVLAIGVGAPGLRGRWRVAVLHAVQLASMSWLHAMVFAWTTGFTSPTYYL